jgi:Zn-finger nucleic acid-binding protein
MSATTERVHCAYCGVENAEVLPIYDVSVVEVAVTPHVRAAGLRCPHCQSSLAAAETKGVLLHGCGECGGIWIDNASAQKVVASADQVFSDLASRAGRAAHAKSAGRSESPRCPQCAARLAPSWFGKIQVDTCASHGTWFDAFELPKVVQAMRELLTEPRVGCASCGKSVLRSRTTLSERGAICDACAAAAKQAEANAIVREAEVRSPLRDFLMELHKEAR